MSGNSMSKEELITITLDNDVLKLTEIWLLHGAEA